MEIKEFSGFLFLNPNILQTKELAENVRFGARRYARFLSYLLEAIHRLLAKAC